MTKTVLVLSHQIHWGKPSGGSITSFRFADPGPTDLVRMVCQINGRFPTGLVPVACMTDYQKKQNTKTEDSTGLVPVVIMTCLKSKEKKHLHSNLEHRIYA